MKRLEILKSIFLCGACTMLLAGGALARDFNIPAGDLKSALDDYARQAGVELVVSSSAVKGVKTGGVQGDVPADVALSRILKGTGFGVYRQSSGALGITQKESAVEVEPMQLAQAAPTHTAVETVTVTSSKLGGGDVQSIPISITALSQEQLTATQTAGGPDLIKSVPNMTFTKTNFSGYSIQIRGIGTQAISVTTDPAVAVAFNDMPFIRNHFFEQEFFDVGQVEVVRGPQGTLYGRNATAGVVNLNSAKPSDQFEAMASADVGNYSNRRLEGMLNIPIVDDRLDIRLAGEWTKRKGYSTNELTGDNIDGRDLWSGRVTIGMKPVESLQMYLIWERFQENDDRLRSGKQLCKPAGPAIGGVAYPYPANGASAGGAYGYAQFLDQGCGAASLYADESFGVPDGRMLPYLIAIQNLGTYWSGINPYQNSRQSTDLRSIESEIAPVYKAKSDIVQFNAEYRLSPALTFISQSGFDHDFLYASEDYNRFTTAPGVFSPNKKGFGGLVITDANGVFCDPQLGCSDRLRMMDLVQSRSWQANQEFRIASKLSGPVNFSLGVNYMHYEVDENYYVFINSMSIFAKAQSVNPDGSPAKCLSKFGGDFQTPVPGYPGGYFYGCAYADPNPLGSLDDKGHNYYLNQNPYVLNSYAAFGEAYVDVTSDVKLTGGLRFTSDRKHFTMFPSELAIGGWGYGSSGVMDQGWDEVTGRFAANWMPKLDFTDQTLFYASYAHGYKAGGANPPGALLPTQAVYQPIHPLSFAPEFINAFELGSKNTLLDGALTLNADAFFYDYKGYQISEIVDRTAINRNYDATVKGAEVEAMWEPTPGLRFNFTGGWEHTRLANGSSAVDLMDRTAGDSDWTVVKPFPTQASNCILPTYVVQQMIAHNVQLSAGGTSSNACSKAYTDGIDPLPVSARPVGYIVFDPTAAPNGGAGISKDLSGNELPNAPRFTVSGGAQYSMPLTSDWAGTLRADYYWQDYSWARVINDNPYDRLRGYTNVNLSLILTSQSGWQVMGYLKNVFNTTDITGAFLNSDDTALTTNVFLTDPRLFGVRVTKNW